MSDPNQELFRWAGRLAAVGELLDVRALQLEAELHNPSASGPYRMSLGIAPTVSQVEDLLFYEFQYTVDVFEADEDEHREGDDGDSQEPVATIRARHALVYRLPAPDDIPEEHLHAFGSVSALLSCHPYARETVQSLSTRLGLPPLTLEALKFPWALPDDAVNQEPTT